MRYVTWIASYPKSGNTWVRVFLEHLMVQDSQVSINRLGLTGFSASSRHLFDQFCGMRAADLTREEVDARRPEVYRYLARLPGRQLFLKAHDAHQSRLFPADISRGAVYLVRNPLDVTVSYGFHLSDTPDFDDIVERLCSPRHGTALRNDRLGQHLPVQIGDWSSHVKGWCNGADFPVVVVRYEDLLDPASDAFLRLGALVDPVPSPEAIERAVARSDFRRLQALEMRQGFVERGPGSSAFFRSGRAGDWRDYLSEAQVRRIVQTHQAVMRRFGYVNRSGRPVEPSGQPRER